MPGEQKIRECKSEFILKTILEKHLPKETGNKSEYGFKVSLEECITTTFLSFMETILLNTVCLKNGVLGPCA
ncbi:MAG: hypothetical protein Roseis2KO_01970 [Roseivirga sp.]